MHSILFKIIFALLGICMASFIFLYSREITYSKPPDYYTSSHILVYSTLFSNTMDKRNETYLQDEITIVTAFTNIGKFPKGKLSIQHTPDNYYNWMKSFEYLQNPTIAFFDNLNDAKYFTSLRNKSTSHMKSIVCLYQRNHSWAFSLVPKIKEVISQPGYPKIYPNTVIPEYQSIQHLKYELLQTTATQNPFKTKYFAWLDIGYFRGMLQSNKTQNPFTLYIPPKFSHKTVAYNQIKRVKGGVSTKKIFFSLLCIWVGGGFFVAERDVMIRWSALYMKYAEIYLSRGFGNSDQQVIYDMQLYESPDVKIQAYVPRPGQNRWFDLGYLCMEEGQKKQAEKRQ